MKKINWLEIIAVLLLLCVLAAAVLTLSAASKTQSGEGARVLEDGIRRAAVSCYACEGKYPDKVEYLTENYGVYVDGERYAVFYEVFADNIMPTVTVMELKP